MTNENARTDTTVWFRVEWWDTVRWNVYAVYPSRDEADAAKRQLSLEDPAGGYRIKEDRQ